MQIKVYKAVYGSPITDEDAQVLGPRFEAMAEELGCVTPEDIVTDAEPKSSPTHDYFEWDNEAAAHRCRLDQAKGYLRYVTVEIESASEPVRAFHNVRIIRQEQTDKDTIVETAQRGYVPISTAMSTPDLWEQVCERALRELQSWRHRYGVYHGLRPIAEGPVQEAIAALMEQPEPVMA